jgi:hypothetical protein
MMFDRPTTLLLHTTTLEKLRYVQIFLLVSGHIVSCHVTTYRLLAEFRRRIKGITDPVFGGFSLAHHGLAQHH